MFTVEKTTKREKECEIKPKILQFTLSFSTVAC